ncbi:hypothetical protein FGO68_gene1545 [Halteria grandinella]|uniref:Uncharacterized protein n=1 Tax=Halteria grandinella TaxID=5974 RepID=A0A8J8P9A4_HALGN|nr:hypothetical protein FGO68_gene1545 [Halteria grandinella]
MTSETGQRYIPSSQVAHLIMFTRGQIQYQNMVLTSVISSSLLVLSQRRQPGKRALHDWQVLPIDMSPKSSQQYWL